MNRVIVIVGASGSGKDWRADNVYPNTKRIDVIGPWRRFLEQTFSLSDCELDTQLGKSRVIPNTNGVTVREYMVSQYHHHKEMGVPIASLMLSNQLYEADDNGHSEVLVTSVRSIEEAEALVEFCELEEVDLVLEVLYNRGKLETSDTELVNVIGTLGNATKQVHFIDNGVENG